MNQAMTLFQFKLQYILKLTFAIMQLKTKNIRSHVRFIIDKYLNYIQYIYIYIYIYIY